MIRNSLIGGSLRLWGENFLPQSQRNGSVPVLPLTSYVNLGKADIFIETQFPLMSMEIVTAPSLYKGVGRGKGENGSEYGLWIKGYLSAPPLAN